MKDNIIYGIILIIVGFLVLGNQLDYWELELFFEGWWTLFIIVPAIVSLIKKEWITGLIALLMGIMFLLAANDIIDYKLTFPVFLIVIGFIIIFGKKIDVKEITNSDYSAIFSGNSNKIQGELKDTSVFTIFGGVDLDLREAKIDKEVNISCVCIFGGIDIIAPKDTEVIVKGTPIFGGIENKVASQSKNKIIINTTCIFGGIEIK